VASSCQTRQGLRASPLVQGGFLVAQSLPRTTTSDST
jgi:hypothetical protein